MFVIKLTSYICVLLLVAVSINGEEERYTGSVIDKYVALINHFHNQLSQFEGVAYSAVNKNYLIIESLKSVKDGQFQTLISRMRAEYDDKAQKILDQYSNKNDKENCVKLVDPNREKLLVRLSSSYDVLLGYVTIQKQELTNPDLRNIINYLIDKHQGINKNINTCGEKGDEPEREKCLIKNCVEIWPQVIQTASKALQESINKMNSDVGSLDILLTKGGQIISTLSEKYLNYYLNDFRNCLENST